MGASRKRKKATTETDKSILSGREMTLQQWLDAVVSGSEYAPRVSPHNCFPTDQMRDDYLAMIKDIPEDDFRTLVRCFLNKSGSYGVDRSIASNIRSPDAPPSFRESEFVRRLYMGRPWEGVTWILDLLPNFPAKAAEVVESYALAHWQLFTDEMYSGHFDAINLIRARFNLDEMRSTFISYGAPDEDFARRLFGGLHENKVKAFFFPEHATPGEKLHRTMRRGITEHDRVILVCSRASLDRKGVVAELEETLAREHRDGEEYLIPIRLDDYVLNGWNPKNQDVAQAVRDHVVADFEGADQDEKKFQAGLQKLIAALRK